VGQSTFFTLIPNLNVVSPLPFDLVTSFFFRIVPWNRHLGPGKGNDKSILAFLFFLGEDMTVALGGPLSALDTRGKGPKWCRSIREGLRTIRIIFFFN